MKLIPTPFYQWGSLVVLGFLVAISPVQAQGVLYSPPTFSLPTPAGNASPMQVFTPAESAMASLADQIPIRWGSIVWHANASYQLSYDSGLQSAFGVPSQSSLVQGISLGLTAAGKIWTLSYTPTLQLYSNSRLHNTVEHNVNLSCGSGSHFEDWTFRLSQGFGLSAAPSTETASQTERTSSSTGLSATRILNDKMSADFSLNQNLQLANGYQSSRDWSTSEGLNYQFWPWLSTGVSVTAGYVDVSSGYNQSYEDLQASINCRATKKISFVLHGGIENMQFLGAPGSTEVSFNGTNFTLVHISPAANLMTPIFGASIQYQPFDYTQISVSANRTLSPSLLHNENTEATTFGVNLSQRLLKTFQLGLGGNFSTEKFTSTATGISVNRTDNAYSFNANLSHAFFKHGAISAFYQYSDNQSSQTGYGVQGNQMGFSISYGY